MDIEQKAIYRFRMGSEASRTCYDGKPLIVTYSGGKDSDVLLRIAEKSGEPFEVLHNLTTADAPQTVHHVKKVFKRLEEKGIKCSINYHEKPGGGRTTMWNLIPRKLMPPTRLVRYCCSELKETGGKNRFIATGVRWDESAARKKNRGIVEVQRRKREESIIVKDNEEQGFATVTGCGMRGKRAVNPIVDWTTEDVLDYCQAEHIDMNPLYECGYTRVGCIGCPMAGPSWRKKEFEDFPAYRKAYVLAFEAMLKERERKGKMEGAMRWGTTGEDVFHWWMEDDVLPGQSYLDGFGVLDDDEQTPTKQ